MTHRFVTFQGVNAIVIYQPIFDRKDQFRGWLNGVISIDLWLKNRMTQEDWKDVYLKIDWPNHKTSH